MQQAEDFRQESLALHALLNPLPANSFEETTQFKAWTINTVLRHLHFWNQMARLQIEDEAQLVDRMKRLAASGKPMTVFEQESLNNLGGVDLLTAWLEEVNRTADVFATADPKARLKWAGPDMSARSSITARLMETWAHGQEVFDHLGVARKNKDRIRNIVVLGVNTFGWTYMARDTQPPGPMPQLQLTAPSGEVWVFGKPSDSGVITGLAEEFCQVVTQTRNIQDTQLKVTGSVAQDWMSKAQCFAGAASEPPAPGTRFQRQAV